MWVFLSFPFLPPPSPPLPRPVSAPPSSSSPSPGPVVLGLLRKSRGLATMWAAPRRVLDYPSHDGPGLLLGRPPPPEWGRCAPTVDHIYSLPRPTPLPSPPLRLASREGSPQQVLGVSPHLLVQTAHEWRARLLRGWPPLPPLVGVLPQPGSGGVPLPAPACHVLRAHAALQVGPPLLLGSGRTPPAPTVCPLSHLPPDMGGCTPPGLACLALGAQAAVPGGPLPLSGSYRAP